MRFWKSKPEMIPEPDFYFAAKGYVQVAVTKREGKDEAFLRNLERGYALTFLETGASEQQALSVRWGGCLAIEDDQILFQSAIDKGKSDALAIGKLPNNDQAQGKEIYRAIYQRAGDFAVRCAWEADRTLYGRFLKQIGIIK